MLLDILSQSNYESYNVKFAKMFGLNAAVYLNLLLDINSKAIKKEKLDNDYFTLDRNYIEERTTLKEAAQKKIDSLFVEYGIFKTDSDNKIFIDLDVLTGIIFKEEPQKPKNTNKIIKKKLTDTEKIADLKTKIYLPCEQIKKPLEDWIDSVYAKDHWMSYKAVINGQKVLETSSYNNGMYDIDIALSIIDIATVNGYRDMEWAANAYKKNHKKSSVEIVSKKFDPNSPALSSEVITL